MPVITIRGQLGSGAPEIGKSIAERLHIDYVDRQIIADVARRLEWPVETIERKEMPPGGLLGRIAEALGRGHAVSASADTHAAAYLPSWELPPSEGRYLEGLVSVIRELAGNESIVIRGRGSQFILKDFPGALHLLVMAPLELRLRRVMDDLAMNEQNARKEIDRFDRGRREFTQRFFNAELENPEHYDLVINTGNVSFDESTSAVIGLLNARQKSYTQG